MGSRPQLVSWYHRSDRTTCATSANALRMPRNPTPDLQGPGELPWAAGAWNPHLGSRIQIWVPVSPVPKCGFQRQISPVFSMFGQLCDPGSLWTHQKWIPYEILHRYRSGEVKKYFFNEKPWNITKFTSRSRHRRQLTMGILLYFLEDWEIWIENFEISRTRGKQL